MPYTEFYDASQRVKSLKLESAVVFKQTPTLAKARVIVSGLEKGETGKKWEKRKEIGELVLIPEKGKWRLIQINIKSFEKKQTKAVKRGQS